MKKVSYILFAALVVFSCQKEKEKEGPKTSDPTKAPQVLATYPENNETSAEVVDEIVITYDKAITLAPNVTVSVNGVYYDEDVYVLDKELYIPVSLRGGNTYTVKVLSPSVHDGDKNFAQDLSFSFTTLTRNNFDPEAFNLSESPADPNATAETKALYTLLKDNFGKKTFSAAMAEVNWNYDNAKALQQISGKYPAINAFDYIHLPSSPSNWIDYGDITPVKEWADMGGIVAAGWHWLVPTSNPNSSMAEDTIDTGDWDVQGWSNSLSLTQDMVDWYGDERSRKAMDAFAQCTVGSTIDVHYKNASGAQMGFRNHNWGNLQDENTTYDYFDIADGNGTYTLTLDAVSLAEIKANGIIIAGHDFLISYVVITHPKENVATVVDFDDVDLGNWAGNVCLTQDNIDWYTDPVATAAMAAFKECEVGSTLTVYYKNASGAQLGYRTHNWAIWEDASSSYNYFDVADGEGSTVLTLDATSLAEIKANGIIIGGHDATITYVEIANPAEPAEVVYSFNSSANDFNAHDAVASGNWQNKWANADLDKLAAYLKLLQDENIPVLFRPLHEASGGWFWWGSTTAEDYVTLWRYVYNYLTAAGVHNLLWVWTSCLDDAAWYPGDEYVDVIANDWYPQAWEQNLYHTSGIANWEKLLEISNTKILTLGECGPIPSVGEALEDGSLWSWWMPWYGEFMSDESINSSAQFRAWMNSSYVITMDDLAVNQDAQL
ncbi:MAG: Ig-like domain-containing protein [Bacteroidales bacterium]|nr:Ig-like domain-containing protein [Bacteroidales bacterium]